MVTKGLLVRLEARPDQREAVEEFLASALPLARDEPGTTAWFGIRFGRSEYGIVDFFEDEEGRKAHLEGQIAKALMERAGDLLTSAPVITPLDVLADKLPSGGSDVVTKGLLLTITPKPDKGPDVEEFLLGARSIVEDEPETVAWFAIALDNGDYGIFDVFPDNAGRFAHLTGHVPRELAKHALSLLGGFPDMDMLNVLDHKLP